MRHNSTYKKTVLNNGLRVISEKVPDVRSVALGVWVDVGSRDETANESGISHFIEHMMFKGTPDRTALQIASSLESLGGSLNAFTSREQTCYHALVLDEHLEQAVDVLSDIITNSRMTPNNIKREKTVIGEEIREVNETPSDRIHDLFSENFWRGQTLGRPIMGSEESVNSLSRKNITGYLDKHYRAGRIVIAAAGNITHDKLLNIVKNKFQFVEGNGKKDASISLPNDFSCKAVKNGGNQTHLCLGFPGVSYNDKRKFPLLVMHYYLGGGMSSALFQKIREQKGLVYTVYTYPDFYRDGGLLGSYMATDKKVLPMAVDIMLKEFKKLKNNRLKTDRLNKIKDQCKGHLILGMESSNSRMNRMARQEIMSSKYTSHHETIRLINAVKASDVIELARQILDEKRLTVTTLGQATQKDLNSIDWSVLT